MRSLFSSLNSFFFLLVLTHSLLSSGKRDFTQVAHRKGKTKPGGFHGHTDPASYLSFCPRFSIFWKSKEFCVDSRWKSDHELRTGGSWKNSSLGFLVGRRQWSAPHTQSGEGKAIPPGGTGEPGLLGELLCSLM